MATSDLTTTLTDRGAAYGDYAAKTAFIQDLKTQMRAGPSWPIMPTGGREALDLIATKIGRLIFGDPTHHDSWIDVAGYAKLAADGDSEFRS